MKFEDYFNKIRNLKNLTNFKKENKIKGNILIAFPNENIESEKKLSKLDSSFFIWILRKCLKMKVKFFQKLLKEFLEKGSLEKDFQKQKYLFHIYLNYKMFYYSNYRTKSNVFPFPFCKKKLSF